jgi:hypothetical protein
MCPQHHILVSGDIIVDHHIYDGERDKPTASRHRGVREVVQIGGAAGLLRLLQAVLKQARDANWTAALGARGPRIQSKSSAHHAFGVWRPFPLDHDDSMPVNDENRKSQQLVWRTHLKLGYGDGDAVNPALTPLYPDKREKPPQPDVLVLDDGGLLFRLAAQSGCWHLPEKKQPGPRWILLKMSDPIARGDLWHHLAQDFSDRLVCLVTAADLTRERLQLNTGLSWERSVDDIRLAVRNNHLVSNLAHFCRHLIITFSADGALWIDHSHNESARATLIFDAKGAEGEWARRLGGEIIGSTTAMAASVAHALARHVTSGATEIDLAPAIERGLFGMRDLMRNGHGLVTDSKPPSGFPTQRIAKVIVGKPDGLAHARLPWPDPPPTITKWTILETSQRPLGSPVPRSVVGLARLVATRGLSALANLPHARFGELTTVDRQEIETLRSIRRLMLAYRDNREATRPLAIGVFGPPGAGKSFGVKQLASEVFGKDAWLEFNLSQFSDADDLMGAFHQARDLVLAGKTPIVFWDEFDTGEYRWLRHLLAPLQDGRFQQGQLNHAIGKGVFVFAGATAFTNDDFGEPPGLSADDQKARKLAKVPDFHSRLDAHYDVLGPNQRRRRAAQTSISGEYEEPDPEDVSYPLRRALFIRSKLERRPDQRLDFDTDLIDTLLLIPKYKHGARSLEKAIAPLQQDHGGPIRRSSLPAPMQLAMHVEFEVFSRILNRNASFLVDRQIEKLAEKIHTAWRNHEHEKRSNLAPQQYLDQDYDDLAEIDKEDNRAAARRIPEVLAFADLGITQEDVADAPTETQIKQQIDHHLGRLAEAEHGGWQEQRERNGWVFAKQRDDLRRHHDMIRPYADLPPENQQKDCNSVQNYPERVRDAGYRIVWLAQAVTVVTEAKDSGGRSVLAADPAPQILTSKPPAVGQSRRAQSPS